MEIRVDCKRCPFSILYLGTGFDGLIDAFFL